MCNIKNIYNIKKRLYMDKICIILNLIKKKFKNITYVTYFKFN